MKPLDLTVYPRRGRETYVIQPPRFSLGAVVVDRLAEAKRLTDAELAAEYWAAAEATTRLAWQLANFPAREQDVWFAIHRFATHPHAAEGGYL